MAMLITINIFGGSNSSYISVDLLLRELWVIVDSKSLSPTVNFNPLLDPALPSS